MYMDCSADFLRILMFENPAVLLEWSTRIPTYTYTHIHTHTDPAAMPQASGALINDLDLRVTGVARALADACSSWIMYTWFVTRVRSVWLEYIHNRTRILNQATQSRRDSCIHSSWLMFTFTWFMYTLFVRHVCMVRGLFAQCLTWIYTWPDQNIRICTQVTSWLMYMHSSCA